MAKAIRSMQISVLVSDMDTLTPEISLCEAIIDDEGTDAYQVTPSTPELTAKVAELLAAVKGQVEADEEL